MNRFDWELASSPFGDLGVSEEDPTVASQSVMDGRYWKYQRVFGVGGSTLHYDGEAHRFPAHSFKPMTNYDFGLDWPIGYHDLENYYFEMETMLDVSGEPLNPFKERNEPYPHPPHRLSKASQAVAVAAESLGWSVLPNSLAIPSRRTSSGRNPCQQSGGCSKGCIYESKSSVDVAVIRPALVTGRLQVLAETRAVRLNAGKHEITGLDIIDKQGRRRTLRAKFYILAAGSIETPRLLLASYSSTWPRGVGNHNGLVGKYLMTTLFYVLNVEARDRLDPYVGPAYDSKLWDFSLPSLKEGAYSGFVLGCSGTAGGYHGPVSYARAFPGVGRRHKDEMRKRFGRIFSIYGIAEQEPRLVNQVTLSTTEVDEVGLPKVNVKLNLSVKDRSVLDCMRNRCREIQSKIEGSVLISELSCLEVPTASHLAGGCIMGINSASSVVDSNCKMHGFDNCYIADASVMPGQGCGDSPSLTIQALALRTSDRVLQQIGG